jgi:aryl-alcohol dehydrogenase-like predicted oxidoreductase
LATIVGLQLEYSLVERSIEREHVHVPAALALGASVTAWSPLASGLLTGKYQRQGLKAKGEGRLPTVATSGNPGFEKLCPERNWTIVEALIKVARDLGRPPAQVALAWIATRPGVASTIVGATSLSGRERRGAVFASRGADPLTSSWCRWRST